MDTGLSLFKSKVAKRIFFLFLLCAMLPITIFSILSFIQVSSQLKEQSILRIQNSAKSYGLILLERFVYLEFELDMIGQTHLSQSDKINPLKYNHLIDKQGNNHLEAVVFINNTGEIINLLGTLKDFPDTLLKVAKAGSKTKTNIFFEPSSNMNTRVFLSKIVSGADGEKGILIGEANTIKLWGIGYESILPPLTDASILDHTRNHLFGSFHLPPDESHRVSFHSDGLDSRFFEYSSGEDDFFIGYWPMFLKSKFEGPNLIILLRKKQRDVFEPLIYFKILFPLVGILAFWIVLLLSITSIRKSMIPLQKLEEGAIRLANRDFGTRVDIRSGDEFQALAETFNQSAAYLGRQFHAMEAMAEIDQVVHSSLNKRTIIDTALKHLHSFFSCDSISIGILNSKKPDTVLVMTYSEPESDHLTEEFLSISPEDREKLRIEIDAFRIDLENTQPSFLSKETISELSSVMTQPLFHNKELSGIICLGHKKKRTYNIDDKAHIKRLTNQLSSALSNALLVEELELLNWGTLEALARTVDTKSRWTAGHSERVAAVAIRIAQAMNFSPAELDNLNRAAFLHDIGKIGISLLILDKNGKLTDDEYEQVKMHPVIGAKIIEPITAYSDAIPVILQHHEKYDGMGYPSGLAGEEIAIGARILAVADVYDAMISNRPYRQGAVKDDVIKIIKSESGRHFDPMVVDAFLSAEMIR